LVHGDRDRQVVEPCGARRRAALLGGIAARLRGSLISSLAMSGRYQGDEAMAAHDQPKLIFPGLAGFYQRFSPYSYALMRFATGAILVPHGVQKILNTPISKFAPNIAAKGLPLPELLAYLTYFAESAAAACLAIGLLTRIAAAIVGIEMLVIVFLFQWQFGYFWTARGYEFALLWVLLCVAIFFKGGGRYSVDRIIGKEF
jgi:putative oxidoreductase